MMRWTMALVFVAPFALAWAARADSTVAFSPTFTVDTRGDGDVTITGRVLNRETGIGLGGATLTIGGRSVTTGTSGKFSIANVRLAAGSALTASKTDFLSQTLNVTAPPKTRAVCVADISLVPDTDKPVVEAFAPDLKGLLLPDVGIVVTATARVNWNGNTPDAVEFYANGSLKNAQGGAGPVYSEQYVVDASFVPALDVSRNSISVVARGATGKKSLPLKVDIFVIPMPEAMVAFVVDAARIGHKVEMDWTYPNPVAAEQIDLPILGRFGAKFQMKGKFEYNLTSGDWKLYVGRNRKGEASKDAKAQFLFGATEANAMLGFEAKGVATPARGVQLKELSPKLALDAKYELGRVGMADLITPGASTALSSIPFLESALRAFSIMFWVKPGLEGTAVIGVSPELSFKRVEMKGKTALEASYEPDIGWAKVKVYAGGEPSVTFQLPGQLIRQIDFKAYCGFEAKTLWFETPKFRYVFVQYPTGPARLLPLEGTYDTGNGYVIEAAGNKDARWRPMEPTWRALGSESFLSGASGPERRLSLDAAERLDQFARMGTVPSPGAVFVPGTGPGRRIASDPALPAEVELPLLSNVFPESEPALADMGGSQLMLLYTRDSGATNPVQFTEVAWTFFDGTSWTTPAAISPDPRGQIEPDVAFDGNGAAVAVWARVKDAGFSGTELSQIAAQMEIVSATRDPMTGEWGEVTPLTDNGFLDHKPRLAGPLSDGDLILIWRENRANLLVGTGNAGASENTRIMTRRWDASAGAWETAEVLVPDLAGELSVSLAGQGGKAVIALTRDMDGNMNDLGDAELFYRIWDNDTNAWGSLTRHTSDSTKDRNAKVAVNTSGGIYCVWHRGDDLVMDRDFAGAPSAVRPDSVTMGFSDFALSVGWGGNLVAVWQEMGEFGPDAHYRVFDPASNTWGLDTLLSRDADLERSFSLAWDSMANLVLAYNNVTITNETVSVELEGGGTVDVPGVPQPGRVDLLLAKRALVRDLSFVEDSLTTTGIDYLPGDAINLKARVKNTGNVAVESVQVAFYDGDPSAGGTLIANVTVPGWLKASDVADVSATWTIPEPAIARTAYVVVDPSSVVTEVNETNNRQSLDLNGVDLGLQYVSGSVLKDGSVRVVARVKNLGAPESPVSTLALTLEGDATPLAQVDVSELGPGASVEVPLDLGPGSHADGGRAYRLVIDEINASGDVDTTNNEELFSLVLWVDEDGDGLPRDWETANAMSDMDGADAELDIDGDGFHARAEYFAGTDPRSSASRLRPGEFNVIRTPGGQGMTCTISWASVEGRIYGVERSFDLKTWENIRDNVAATPPLNTVSEDITPAPVAVFYRIGLR